MFSSAFVFSPQGTPKITTCVLKVQGRVQLNDLRLRYGNFVRSLDQNSRLLRPMTTYWNLFAFIKDAESFRIEDHVLMGPLLFKSCPINEFNIEDHIRSLIEENLPSHLPQWQLKVVSIPSENIFYLLLKAHHLLLRERKHDLFDLFKPLKGMHVLSQNVFNEPITFNVLLSWIPPPFNTIAIYNNFTAFLMDRINNFVHKIEPLERHEGIHKEPKNISDLASALVMIFFNVYRRHRFVCKSPSTINIWINSVQAESERWQINWVVCWQILLNTINPINILGEILKLFCRFMILMFFKFPLKFLCELEMLHSFLFLNQNIPSSSFLGFVLKYFPMFIGSLKEIIELLNLALNLAFNGPRIMFEVWQTYWSVRYAHIYWKLTWYE